MTDPYIKKNQPWRVNLHQPNPVCDRNLSIVQGEDRLWYIFHHNPELEGLGLTGLAYTGGGFDEQADAVDEALNYLKIFGTPVDVS